MSGGGLNQGSGKLGCLLLVLILLAWPWLWSERKDAPDLRRFAPPDSILLLETSSPDAILQACESLGMWKDAAKAGRESELLLHGKITATVGSLSLRDVNDIRKQIRRVSLAFATGAEGKPDWIAALETREPARILDILRESLNSSWSSGTVEGLLIDRLTLADGSFVWLRAFDRILVVTPDRDLLRFALVTGQETGGGDFFQAPELREGVLACGVVRLKPFAAWLADRERSAEKTGYAAVAREHLREEALVGFELVGDGAGNVKIETRWLAENPAPARGWGYYLLLIVFAPVALVLGLLVLFLLTAAVMALYFYLCQKKDGKLSPAVPEQLPEVSEPAREDLESRG